MGFGNDGGVHDLEMYSEWMWAVSQYSAGQLTNETDKLAAIQGLANELKKSREDDYIMGLWTGELPEALLWTRSYGYLERIQALAAFPSWSWASTRGYIQPVDLSLGHCARRIGAYVDTADEGRRLVLTGLATNGRISDDFGDQTATSESSNFSETSPPLEGPLDYICDEKGDHHTPMLERPWGYILGEDGELLGFAAFDEDLDYNGDRVHCLCLCEGATYSSSEVLYYYGLLLKWLDPCETSDSTSPGPLVSTYSRLGVCAIMKGPWTGTMKEELAWIV